jgi:hypothetical protein
MLTIFMAAISTTCTGIVDEHIIAVSATNPVHCSVVMRLPSWARRRLIIVVNVITGVPRAEA